MGEAATAAETVAAVSAAAAPIAETALASTLPGMVGGAGALAPEAGAAQGIMQAAGSSAATTAGASPTTTAGGSFGTTAGTIAPASPPPPVDTTAAFDMNQMQAMNAPAPAPAPSGGPMANINTTATPADAQAASNYYTNAQNADIASKVASNEGILSKTGNGLLDGFNAAKSFVTDTAESAYKAYKEAPAALQYASTALAAKPLLFPTPHQGGPAKYKRTPYDGLSPDFQAGGPSPYLYGFAAGGITGTDPTTTTAPVGPVEHMSQQNSVGANTGYPMASQQNYGFTSTIVPSPQRPISQNMLDPEGEMRTDPYTGEPTFASGGIADDDDEYDRETEKAAKRQQHYSSLMSTAAPTTGVSHRTEGFGIIPRSRAQSLGSPNTAAQAEMAAMMKKYGIKSALPKALDPQGSGIEGAANGGIMHGLGGYSDGGRLLRGPGDGVSDSIPAQIGSRQPARLADGEFVVPARIVSELGNGSTEAGARQLYAMMDRVQKGRKKSVGKGKVAVDSKAAKHLPA
jgi:hypothetical protein